jgi:hypothetical protein
MSVKLRLTEFLKEILMIIRIRKDIKDNKKVKNEDFK